MERKDARKEWYELMEIDGTTVIFTNMRIDRSTIPDGYTIDATGAWTVNGVVQLQTQ